jgi:hypothetical protein
MCRLRIDLGPLPQGTSSIHVTRDGNVVGEANMQSRYVSR